MSELGICFIDFETSGIDVFRDEPFEIGAVLLDDQLCEVKRYYSRIKPAKRVYLRQSAYITHNISLTDLQEAPLQNDVLSEFFDVMGSGYRFGGWNINFDVSFFRKLCNKNGFMGEFNKINHRHLDVQTIAYLASQLKLLPSDVKSLSNLISYFGLVREQKHNALEDAILTSKVYLRLLKLYENRVMPR